MSTQAYWAWAKAGRPWKKAVPIAELETLARRHRVAVLGTLGDDSHLKDPTPEDHTPFSIDAWPVSLPGYVVTAIDLKNEQNLGSRLLSDGRAGRIPWLKYLNFNGRHYDARHNWQPRSSADRHVHVSIRSDWCNRSIGDYNPFTGGGSQPGPYTVVAWHRANVRHTPRLSGKIVSYVAAGNSYPASCWTSGDTVTAEGYTNDVWIKLPLNSGGFGYVTAIYLKGDKYANLPAAASC